MPEKKVFPPRRIHRCLFLTILVASWLPIPTAANHDQVASEPLVCAGTGSATCGLINSGTIFQDDRTTMVARIFKIGDSSPDWNWYAVTVTIKQHKGGYHNHFNWFIEWAERGDHLPDFFDRSPDGGEPCPPDHPTVSLSLGLKEAGGEAGGTITWRCILRDNWEVEQAKEIPHPQDTWRYYFEHMFMTHSSSRQKDWGSESYGVSVKVREDSDVGVFVRGAVLAGRNGMAAKWHDPENPYYFRVQSGSSSGDSIEALTGPLLTNCATEKVLRDLTQQDGTHPQLPTPCLNLPPVPTILPPWADPEKLRADLAAEAADVVGSDRTPPEWADYLLPDEVEPSKKDLDPM